MSFKSATTASAADRTAALWDEIDRTVRESCALRCERRDDEAATLLQHTLPALIREWSAGAGRSREDCRAALRQLFADAQERVATALLCKRLVIGSLGGSDSSPTSAPAHASASRPAAGQLHLRRRVPIDDIAGMLDALDENERVGRFLRQPFPTASRAPLPALALA